MKHEITFMKYFYLISIQHSLRMRRSSQQRCSVRNVVLEISQNLQKKTNLCQNLIFNKVAGLRPATLLKRDPGTGVFLWILWNFQEHLSHRTPLGDCFCMFLINKKLCLQYRVTHKAKTKKTKNTKTYLNETMFENQERQSACANIFLELSLTI